jgi:hypothetical protein
MTTTDDTGSDVWVNDYTTSDAHPHTQVVPSSWQHGGPITLASDKGCLSG